MKKKNFKLLLTAVITVLMSMVVIGGCGSNNKSDKETDSANKKLSNGLPKSIVIGCMPDYPPYDYQDEDGNITGYDVAVTLEACKRLGIEGEFVVYPWDSLLPALDAGKVQMVSAQIYRSDERAEKYNFSYAPYFKSTVDIIVNANSTAESLEDVVSQELNFTCIPGQLNEQYLKKNNVKFSYIEGTSQNQIDDVVSGHSDGFLNQWPLVNKILKDNNEEGALKVIGEPITSDFVYSLFQKTDEGAELAKAFSEVYIEMMNDGTLAKLSEEYLGSDAGTDLEAGILSE